MLITLQKLRYGVPVNAKNVTHVWFLCYLVWQRYFSTWTVWNVSFYFIFVSHLSDIIILPGSSQQRDGCSEKFQIFAIFYLYSVSRGCVTVIICVLCGDIGRKGQVIQGVVRFQRERQLFESVHVQVHIPLTSSSVNQVHNTCMSPVSTKCEWWPARLSVGIFVIVDVQCLERCWIQHWHTAGSTGWVAIETVVHI